MTAVNIIVDPEYGDRLEKAARIAPTWVIATKANRGVFEPLWKSDSHPDHREVGAITSYKISNPEDRLGNLLGIVPTVLTHHGEINRDEFAFPKGVVLEAIG